MTDPSIPLLNIYLRSEVTIFCKQFYWNTAILIYVMSMAFSYVRGRIEELCQRLYGQQNLKCLSVVLLQKKFADLSLEKWVQMLTQKPAHKCPWQLCSSLSKKHTHTHTHTHTQKLETTQTSFDVNG